MDYNKLQALAKARSAAAFAASPMSTMSPEDEINAGVYQGMNIQDKRSYGLAPAQASEPSKMEQYLNAKNSKLNTQHALTSTSSGNALQQALSDMVDQQVYTAQDGSKYQEMYTKDAKGSTVITKVPYTQETKYGSDTRNLYIDDTAEGAMKLGLAATGKGGYYGRYKPELGGWKPGPKGVTPEDGALMDIQLPYNVATKFEHGVHSNRGQLANRAIGQGPVTAEDIANYGSGKTEYTTQNAPMWNQETAGNALLQAGTPLPKPLEKMHTYDDAGSTRAEDGTLIKAGKALESGAFNLVSRGMQTGMYGIEAIGEAIGSEQLARGARVMQKRLDQQRKDGTYDKYLGYSPAQVEEYGKKFSNNVQKGEYWEALKGIASDPESAFVAFAQSTPEMAAMMTGVGLAAVVGINVNNNLYTLEQTARAQGRETTVGEKGTSVGLSVVTTLLDRLGDKAMMGGKVVPGKLTDAITTTLSKMTPTVRNEVLGQLGGRLAKAGIATGEFVGRTAMEGATEGIQTLGENKATDVNKMNMNLTQQEIDQALEATGIGLGAGGVGTTVSNPSLATGTVKDVAGAVKDTTFAGLNKLAEVSAKRTKADVIAKNITKAEAVAAEKAAVAGEPTITPKEIHDTAMSKIEKDMLDNITAYQNGDMSEEEYTTKTKEAETSIADIISTYETSKNVETVAPVQEDATQPKSRNEGDPINISSQINVGDGKHVTLDFNPEGVNSAGPDMSIGKEGSQVRVEVTGQYADNNMAYRTVQITTPDGKVHTTQKDGTPLHITDYVNTEAGIKPFQTGQHAKANPTSITSATGTLTGTTEYLKGVYSSSMDKSIPAAEDRTAKITKLVTDHKAATEAITDEEYTPAKDVEVTAKLAAVEKLESLFDKAKNVGLELIKGDSTALKNVSNKKNKQYRVEAISDTVITDMLEGKGVSDTVGTESLSGNRVSKGLDMVKGANVERIKGEVKRVKEKMTPEAKAALSKIIVGDEATDADIARILAIGISAVEDNIVAETNKSGTADVAREDTLAVQLGKEHINSFGVNVTGKAKDVASVNKERGTAILDFLQQVGVIERNEDLVPVSAKDVVGEEGTKLKPGSSKVAVSKEGDKLFLKTVALTKNYKASVQPAVVRKDGTIDQEEIVVDNPMVSAMKMMNRLFNPVNNEMVTNEGQDVVIAHKAEKEVKLSKEHEDIIKAYSKLKYKIKPEFMSLLKELRTMLDGSGARIKKEYTTNPQTGKVEYVGEDLIIDDIDFDKFFKHPDVVKLLGTNKKVPKLLRGSELGKFIGRSGSLAKLLENLDAIETLMNEEDGFNFNYESAINERIHVMQTVLDFQGDKYMARQMITDGEHTVKEGAEVQMLVKEVASELNKMMGTDLSMEQILELDGIKAIAETDGLSLKGLLKAKDKLGIRGIHSPFKLLSLLQAMKDISKAYNGTSIVGDIKTSYVVQNDASASGVMNTLMNLSGIKAVQDMLTTIWSGTDPYAIVSDKVSSLFESDKYAKSDAKTKAEELDNAIESKDFMRDLAKFLVMPWFYGQSDTNAKQTFGDSVATKLYEDAMLLSSEEASDLLVKITGNKNLFYYTKEDLAKVATYFAEDLGETYVEAVTKSFPEVVAYRNDMGKIFKMLEKTKQWNGSIRSAFAAMDNNSKEKMSVKKLKSVMLQDTTSTPLTVNEMLNNDTSFKVNLQHGVDASILLNTMKKLMEEFPNLKGTMTVHDAIYSTPEVAMKAVKYYNEFAVDAALEYDFMEEALSELETAAKAMEEGNQVKLTALGLVAELRAKNDTAMKAKEAFLGDKSLEVMGEGGERAETYNSRKPAKEAKQSETDKARAELQAKFEANQKVITDVAEAVRAKDLYKVLDILRDNLPISAMPMIDKIDAALEKGLRIEFTKDGEFQAVHGVVLVPEDMTKDPINSTKNLTVEMTPEMLVEILAHEVDHAVQLNWIRKNLDSGEVKYVKRALDKVLGSKSTVKGMPARLAHLANPIKQKDAEALATSSGMSVEDIKLAYQVSEFSSMMNEGAFKTAVADILKPGIMTQLMQHIKKMIGNAYNTMAEFLKGTGLNDVAQLDIDIDMTQEALRMLQNQSLGAFVKRLGPVGTAEQKSNLTPKETANKALDAVGQGFQRADSITADFLVIWGDAFYEMAVPNVTKAHETMLRSSRAYNVATDALNTFVFDSDWMKRLQTRLGVAGDNMEQLQSDMLTEMDAYQQESRQLAEDLTALKRNINKNHSEKEATDIWKIFAGTNVSDLSPTVWERLLSGVSIVDSMLEDIANTLSTTEKTKLDALANYYATGITTDGNTNVEMAQVMNKDAALYVALKGLSSIKDSQKLLSSMDETLVKELRSLAVANRKLNDQINRLGLGDNGLRYSPNATFNINYDGTYLMDVVDIGKEVVAVDAEEMETLLKAKGGKAWTVVSNPDGDMLGVMVRDNMDPGRTSGVGLSLNRYVNGIMIGGDKAKAIQAKLEKIPKETDKKAFLTKNNLVVDGYKFRMLMSTEDKITHLGMKQDIAESMYRTLMHNKDLMASEGVRQMVLEKGLRKIGKQADMDKLIEQLTFNYKQGYRGEKIEMEPFINITMPYEDIAKLLKDNPMLNRYYKIPDNVTSFNGFNKNIQLVQRGPAEILLGHANFSIFKNDHPELAKWERAYKQVSSLIKQRMIVLSPTKLANDTISTVGILSIMGMSPTEVYEGYKNGTKDYAEYARERTKLVELELEVLKSSEEGKASALKRRDAQKKKMEDLPFHDAFRAGFIQSQGTEMMTTDADTISGLQKNIHEIINKYTRTKQGDPNVVYKAIKWFQTAGINVDELLIASSKYASTKNVTVGEAMIKMADILKSKKEDKDVAGYISELLLLPGSTAVNAGGAYMVGSDAIGKYALQQWLLTQPNKKTGKKYTKKEAAYVAMRQIIDYRPNMPSEINTLSDYNILLFPAFWMNVQRPLFHLAKSHPISSIGAYGLSAAVGHEDTNIFMQNIITKQESFNGLVHVPMGVNTQWVTDLLNG